MPIQVVKREGKGAVGRYGNEDPNRAASKKGESSASIAHDGIRCCLSLSGADNGDVSKSGKKKEDPGAPQWKRQPREVIDPIVYLKSILSIFLILESTEAEISLSNIGRRLERTNNEIPEE